MRILIKTPVELSYKKVYAQFDENLFLALNPPLLPVQLIRFDGSKTGDQIHLSFPFKMKWVSYITEDKENEKECYFVDEGKVLPFPLEKWTHRHRILHSNQGSLIIDDIEFSTVNVLFDYLLYPLLWLQFIYRKPIYQKYFSAK